MRRIYPFLVLFLGLIILSGCSANKPANNSQNEPKIDEATLALNEAAAAKAAQEATAQQAAVTDSNQGTTTVNPLALVNSKPLTLAEVTKHASVDNCWMLINGQVYDLSSYTKAGNHPGGDKILNGCGKDATVLFQSIGKHQENAINILPSYLLGNLQP